MGLSVWASLFLIHIKGIHPTWVVGLGVILRKLFISVGPLWVVIATSLGLPIFRIHNEEVLTSISVAGLMCLSVLTAMEVNLGVSSSLLLTSKSL